MPRVEGGDPGHHQRILFMGHAASCITLIKSLAGSKAVGLPLRIGTCSLTTLKRNAPESSADDRQPILGAFDLVGLAEAGFLEGGVERDWGFEDITVDETGRVIDDPGEKGTENETDDNAGLQIRSARM